jgi:hypothetical protein
MKLTKGKLHKIFLLKIQTRKNYIINRKTKTNVLSYKNNTNFNLKNKTLKNINY